MGFWNWANWDAEKRRLGKVGSRLVLFDRFGMETVGGKGQVRRGGVGKRVYGVETPEARARMLVETGLDVGKLGSAGLVRASLSVVSFCCFSSSNSTFACSYPAFQASAISGVDRHTQPYHTYFSPSANFLNPEHPPHHPRIPLIPVHAQARHAHNR